MTHHKEKKKKHNNNISQGLWLAVAHEMRRKIHGFEESAAMFIRCLGMRCSPK
jgi:hypothetical protein